LLWRFARVAVGFLICHVKISQQTLQYLTNDVNEMRKRREKNGFIRAKRVPAQREQPREKQSEEKGDSP